MTMNSRLILLCTLLIPLGLSAQNDTLRNNHYLELSALGSASAFRDQGVSPLLYEGFMIIGGGRYLHEKGKWSNSYEVMAGVGFYEVSRLAIYEASSINFAYGGHTRYEFWSSPSLRLRYEGGIRFHGYTNIRSNPNFLNASSGVESLNTLFLSNYLEWQFTRRKKMAKNAGEPVRRRLVSLEVNLPLINTAWLTDYAYITDFTDGDTNSTDEHSLYWGGLRFQTRFTYRHFLKNGNALRFAYWWDYLRTPKGFNQLEMYNHSLEFALVIRLN